MPADFSRADLAKLVEKGTLDAVEVFGYPREPDEESVEAAPAQQKELYCIAVVTGGRRGYLTGEHNKIRQFRSLDTVHSTLKDLGVRNFSFSFIRGSRGR